MIADSSVKLAIVGDMLPMAALPTDGTVSCALSVLQEADIAFGNLEAAVSRRGAPAEKFINLRTDPDRLVDLQRAGFKVMKPKKQLNAWRIYLSL